MNDLSARMAEFIQSHGPISVAQFMTLALADNKAGYYRDRDPLGQAGDFTTSPEICQIFGELIGACLAQVWLELGAPPKVVLVELGPGRGTLMSDALRATKRVPGWIEAIELHLVETNHALRAQQKKALAPYRPRHHSDLSELPDGAPLFIVANEFLDCLPIHQFVRVQQRWRERRIAFDGKSFAFALDQRDVQIAGKDGLPPGSVIETSPAREAAVATIAERLRRQDGVCILIDYGHYELRHGDTFQAVRRQEKTNPLLRVGECDLTSHVDFAPLAKIACDAGCRCFGPIAQRTFLSRLGANERLQALGRLGTSTQRQSLESGLARLLDPDGMGSLFQVMGISGSAHLPAFNAEEERRA